MSSAAQQIRLLVVDDDRLVLANLADGLEQAGYAVSRAATGEDAIRICAEAPPDLEITEAQLRVALQGDRNIGIATGILMERSRLTATETFETLRGRARPAAQTGRSRRRNRRRVRDHESAKTSKKNGAVRQY